MGYPARFALLFCFVFLTGLAPAAAQSDTATLNAPINSQARLSFSTVSITFPDADPDTVPNIPALQGPITITAKSRTSVNGAVTLTVQANDQLRSGLDTIPASQTGAYAIQVAALNDPLRAKDMVSALKATGMPVYLVSPPAADPDAPYRVRVGPYATRTAAQETASALEKSRGEKLWITKEK